MYDFYTIFFSIITILLAIGALVQTCRANKFQKQIAKAQKVFSKTNIEILPFAQKEITSFIFALPMKEHSVFELPLKIGILNNGDKTAEDIEIYQRANRGLFFDGNITLTNDTNAFKNAKLNRIIETKHMCSLILSIQNMHPKQAIEITIPIKITSPTISKRKTPVELKDGIGAIVSWWLNYAFTINCIMTHKDNPPVFKKISIRSIDTKNQSIEDFLKNYNKSIMDEYKDVIKSQSFMKKIKYFLYKRKEIAKIAIIIVDIKKSSKLTISNDKGINIYRVPSDALKAYEGIEDKQGICIPALNIF